MMKKIVLLFVVCVTVAVGLPPQNQNRLRRQTSSAGNNQAQPNFGFGNFQFPTGSWPAGQGQGQGFDQLWSQPSSIGSLSSRGSFGFDFPNIEGADGVTATAGMTCTSENGKKKCTKHQRQEKVRY
ncbi:uncharacterized protein LOC134225954 [Armigeres subalbatus]|uniref:uncharacterized protein LOC134225954 n=1 Tax=Armigeres subalbatus TaxID=124917 RepID=UPI002ED3B745